MREFEKRDEQGDETPPASNQPVAKDDMDMAKSQSRSSPAFQFYPKDFLSSSRVQRMTLAEIGAYIILLSHAWLSGGIPPEVPEIAKIVKVPAPRFAKMWRGVLSECFVKRGRLLVNERLDIERQRQIAFREKQAANGRKGGRQSAFDSDKSTLNPDGRVGFNSLNPNKAIKEIADSKQRSGSLVSSEGSLRETTDDPPCDVWLRELQAAYPPSAVSSGHLTEVAFLQQVMSFGTPQSTFTAMLVNLDNQKRGHQWRVKGMIPRLDRWLSEGLWQQTHEAAPVSQLVSEKTARTLTSGAMFVAGGE